MLLNITTFERIKKEAEKVGRIPTSKAERCSRCGKTIAFWAGFERKEFKYLRPLTHHTQVVCGIHPRFSKTKDEFNFQKNFVLGFGCCEFNILGEVIRKFIPEAINRLGDKVVVYDNPEPENGKGYFVTMKEIIVTGEEKDGFAINREMFLQTHRELFWEIVGFLENNQ